MKISVKIQGLDNLQKLFNDAPKQLQDGIADSLSDLADDIYNTTTGLCPVDTGALVKSIEVTKSQDSIEASAGMDYASYVDEGTSRMGAQPFFQDPINQILNDFQSKMEDKIGSLFE